MIERRGRKRKSRSTRNVRVVNTVEGAHEMGAMLEYIPAVDRKRSKRGAKGVRICFRPLLETSCNTSNKRNIM